jgi:hypothetical protein
MSAGVKPAAIVNYEKYVTHPPPIGPVKKAAKSAPKASTRVLTHRASAKPKARHVGALKNARTKAANTVIPASSKAAALDKSNTSKPAPSVNKPPSPALKRSANTAAPATQQGKPLQPAALSPSSGQKKPSPGIPKETSPDQR